MPGFSPPGSQYPGEAFLDESGSISAPFIAAETEFFTPLLQGTDISAPFIAATTTVYAGSVAVSGGNARVSQLPVEAIVLPDNAGAVISQLAVEIVVSIPTVTVFHAFIITTPPSDAPG